MVDKAIRDGMRGMAITDHGNMMGIKEFFNYTSKVRGKAKDIVKDTEAKLEALQNGSYQVKSEDGQSVETMIEECKAILSKQRRIADFKPIFGCEMYVARRGDKTLKQDRVDQSGWHLIVLAKNEQGYHNLIKLVSNSWVDGFTCAHVLTIKIWRSIMKVLSSVRLA